MKHAELHSALKSFERGLPAFRTGHGHGFRPAFEAQVAHLAAQAEDVEDAVYVIERADAMLGDLGID